MAAAGLEAPVGDLGVMIERTKASLGRLVSKPPMRDKLLSRPPFRFVHDAVTAVTDATGYLRGAFSGPELEPKSMERDEKLHFLTKLLDLLAKSLGKPLGVDPMKVAAGKEPEMTNYMLQVRPSRGDGQAIGWNAEPRGRPGNRATDDQRARAALPPNRPPPSRGGSLPETRVPKAPARGMRGGRGQRACCRGSA